MVARVGALLRRVDSEIQTVSNLLSFNNGDLTIDTVLLEVVNDIAVNTIGSVAFTSSPSGAEIYVQGNLVGRTPFNLNAEAANYQVELRLANYRNFQTVVEVIAGQTTKLGVNLEAVQQTTSLNIGSSPSGAEVYIDGTLLTETTKKPKMIY